MAFPSATRRSSAPIKYELLRGARGRRRSDAAWSEVLVQLLHLENLIAFAVFGLLDPRPVQLDAISRFDGRCIAVKGVRFRITGLKLEPIWTFGDTAFECVVAVIDFHKDNDCDGDDSDGPNRSTNDLAGAGADARAGRLAACRRGGSGTKKHCEPNECGDAKATVPRRERLERP